MTRPLPLLIVAILLALPAHLFADSNLSANLITALVEPSLTDDGRLSPDEVQAIRTVAAKVLNAAQREELEAILEQRMLQTSVEEPADAPETPAPVESLPFAGACDAGCDWCEEEPKECCLDNLSFFMALDGSKQPQDLGINANMGGRGAVNWGFPILKSIGLGGQIGTSANYHDSAVHVLDQVEGTANRWQIFTTVGVFQRTKLGLNWGMAYDYLSERYYDHIDVGQWRGQLSYQLNQRNEIGAWFTIQDRNDTVDFLGATLRLEPLSQGNLFWRHTWGNFVQTTAWLGMAEGHGREVFSISQDPPTTNVLTYGAEIFVPLNDCFAIYGAANFLTPADTGTVDAFLGIAFYPRGSAKRGRSRRFAPLLPVASNPFFAVDLRQ